MLNGNLHLMLGRLAGDRRQGLEIGEQVARVGCGHALIRRVRKRRIVVTAVRRRALPERGDEIGLGPGADAVLRIGRDVRHGQRAERRLHGEPAAEPGLVVLAGAHVARRAAAGEEHGLAVVQIGRVGGQRAGRNGRRNGHEPEHRTGDHRQGDHQDRKLAHHRRPSSPVRNRKRHLRGRRHPTKDEGGRHAGSRPRERQTDATTGACDRCCDSRRNSCAPRRSAP